MKEWLSQETKAGPRWCGLLFIFLCVGALVQGLVQGL